MVLFRDGLAMIQDIHIWRAANLLIKQHGADAEVEATRRADLLLRRGDGRAARLGAHPPSDHELAGIAGSADYAPTTQKGF
jgi:hypothetical protein